ncbi:MAG: sulfatase-like hydrolase/transferase [Terriglobia bacterium]
MGQEPASGQENRGVNRRDFVRRSAGIAGALAGLPTTLAAQQNTSTGGRRPNVIIFHADQFRWDCLGAYGLNPMGLTPNLDGVAGRGALFANAITNQPLCSPSRACLMTGQYGAKNGVWGNGPGLTPGVNTIATAFRGAGYTANYIGKWHLAGHHIRGAVPPEYRGGFLDLWEASNVLEFTSRPYQGDLYDNDGKPIHFSGIYRVDFITDLAVRFLRQKPREPFLLMVANLEPHFQNGLGRFVAPEGYAARYANPFVPHDLRFFPGDWPSQLPDYYGCVAKIDEAAGAILKTLAEEGLEDHTIFAFTSDHGCHFKTRNTEYKRSPHESSIHVPLVIQGPGFGRLQVIQQLVGMVDIAPTLLDAAGVPIPDTMQGKSAIPLLQGKTEGWRNEIFIQLAEFVTGRALRTEQWTYAVGSTQRGPETPSPIRDRYREIQTHNLTGGSKPAPYADRYVEYQLYNLFSDPHQLVNLAGRDETLTVAEELRERLKSRMAEVGDHPAEIGPPIFPYP